MIYILESGEKKNRFLKVGYSKSDVRARIKQIQTGNPYKVELLSLRAGSHYDEALLHKKCEKFNVRNEWFKDCPEVRDILGVNFYPMQKDKLLMSSRRRFGDLDYPKLDRLNAFFFNHRGLSYDYEWFKETFELNDNQQGQVHWAVRQFGVFWLTYEEAQEISIYQCGMYKGRRNVIASLANPTFYYDYLKFKMPADPCVEYA